ncbi:MAG: TMEM175 family protein [Ferruginibacter sp.]
MTSRYVIPTTRIEAFSDGVCAIVMTLLAFQFKVPEFTPGAGMNQHVEELLGVSANFISFIFSFLFVAVFWVNHHQLFHSIKEANRKLLWLNIHLLFWITMIPFPTGMVGDHPNVPLAAISLGFVLLMVSVASYLVRNYSYNQAAKANENTSAKNIKEGSLQDIVAIILTIAAIITTVISVKISYIILFCVLIVFSIPHRSEWKKLINNKEKNKL